MDSEECCLIKNAEKEDVDELSRMLYETENYPDEEWGSGNCEEHLIKLRRVMFENGNRFSYSNFKVLKKGKETIGFFLAIEGSKLKIKTLKADIKLYKMQEGIKNKLRFLFQIIVYLFHLECLFNEYYLSNIYVKKEYRGLGYSHILLEALLSEAVENKYRKISLRANNKKLIKFYNSYGYKKMKFYKNKMILKI